MAGKLKRVGDVVGGNLYPELPKKPLADILGTDIELQDVTFLKGGYGEYVVFKFAYEGEEFTSICGGMVVVEKFHNLMNGGHLPIIGCITKPGDYYDVA